ncbi:hypothetical protein [Paenibacillus tianjinensis]|uniref:Uncharacterized protein n=1 Tax=Paenibacillus tianjinensis TaxID=2810347 RepID=A0ABX7LAF7_9BACL|nr:hypothetical protein [Paenibacillus tianjinensis]QSF44358.1 hypothetical protein JRJ22_24590 [Paenibacillus tianjinensis]
MSGQIQEIWTQQRPEVQTFSVVTPFPKNENHKFILYNSGINQEIYLRAAAGSPIIPAVATDLCSKLPGSIYPGEKEKS